MTGVTGLAGSSPAKAQPAQPLVRWHPLVWFKYKTREEAAAELPQRLLKLLLRMPRAACGTNGLPPNGGVVPLLNHPALGPLHQQPAGFMVLPDQGMANLPAALVQLQDGMAAVQQQQLAQPAVEFGAPAAPVHPGSAAPSPRTPSRRHL